MVYIGTSVSSILVPSKSSLNRRKRHHPPRSQDLPRRGASSDEDSASDSDSHQSGEERVDRLKRSEHAPKHRVKSRSQAHSEVRRPKSTRRSASPQRTSDVHRRGGGGRTRRFFPPLEHTQKTHVRDPARPTVARSQTERSERKIVPLRPDDLNRRSTIREPFRRNPPPVPLKEERRNEKTSTREQASSAASPSRTRTTRSKRQSPAAMPSVFSRPPATKVQPKPEEKKVECLTCMSDDVPASKAAELKCGHTLCHDCLKRLFNLSLTDPQHMPPKCCTQSHIPLRHVEKLFNYKFKVRWNRKYHEYSTKNRIYCPKKGCGRWIKPAHIHVERSSGRKYGKCSHCKTKVCTKCNGKWHSRRDCPKDEETVQFAEVAEKEGWKKCYNCSAMVELREGCNHMTCRCTAEFCMICGAKWKTCNCPWFNNQQVEADRWEHANADEVPVRYVRHRPRDGRPVGPQAIGYADEMARRQRQEVRDEAIARRLQLLDFGEFADEVAGDEEWDEDIDDEDEEDEPGARDLDHDIIRVANEVLGEARGAAVAAMRNAAAPHRAAVPPMQIQRQRRRGVEFRPIGVMAGVVQQPGAHAGRVDAWLHHIDEDEAPA